MARARGDPRAHVRLGREWRRARPVVRAHCSQELCRGGRLSLPGGQWGAAGGLHGAPLLALSLRIPPLLALLSRPRCALPRPHPAPLPRVPCPRRAATRVRGPCQVAPRHPDRSDARRVPSRAAAVLLLNEADVSNFIVQSFWCNTHPPTHPRSAAHLPRQPAPTCAPPALPASLYPVRGHPADRPDLSTARSFRAARAASRRPARLPAATGDFRQLPVFRFSPTSPRVQMGPN